MKERSAHERFVASVVGLGSHGGSIGCPFRGTVTAAPSPGTQGTGSPHSDGTLGVMSRLQAGSRIGVSIVDIESSDVGGALDEGAVVEEVADESPAAQTGLRIGDIFVEYDRERVRSARQLARLVQETPAGREVSARVVRNGERLRLDVTPEEGPGILAAMAEKVPEMDGVRRELRRVFPSFPRTDRGPGSGFDGALLGDGRRLGVGVADVGPQLLEYFGVDGGVLVTGVESDSVAATAGLRAGDVITSVGGQSVDDVGMLRRIIGGIEPPATVKVVLTRDGSEMTLEARFEGEAHSSRRRGRNI